MNVLIQIAHFFTYSSHKSYQKHAKMHRLLHFGEIARRNAKTHGKISKKIPDSRKSRPGKCRIHMDYFSSARIRSTAALVSSAPPKAVTRIYPSPLGPKPAPGVVTTPASVSNRSKKLQESVGVLNQT